jgi:hypothetical protein
MSFPPEQAGTIEEALIFRMEDHLLRRKSGQIHYCARYNLDHPYPLLVQLRAA